jgi:hypothetical protein
MAREKVSGAAASPWVGGRAPRKAGGQVPVSMRALIQRINRKLLREDGEELKKCRADSRWYSELGDYYAVDLNRNLIVNKHVNPEKWGRELGVLADYERVVED